MGIAVHYIGLIGWRELEFSHNDVVFCDSLSLLLLARLLGFKLKYLPGSKSVNNLDTSSKENVYLTPFLLKQFPEDSQIVLPMLSSVKQIPKQTSDWLNSKKGFKRIYIGISTPNQNLLGSLLACKYKASIHCVGAALIEAGRNEYKLVSTVSGSGMEWAYRAIKSPKRFLNKVSIIIREFLVILFQKERRVEFKFFLSRIQQLNSLRQNY